MNDLSTYPIILQGRLINIIFKVFANINFPVWICNFINDFKLFHLIC